MILNRAAELSQALRAMRRAFAFRCTVDLRPHVREPQRSDAHARGGALPAALLLLLFLSACGGGGGGDSGGAGSGSNAPQASGNASVAAVALPAFTPGFAQFTGAPSAIAVGDLNGDGADDVVVVTADRFGSGAGSERLYVFYRTPNGPVVKFAATASADATDKSSSTAVCDIDGDGKNEILVGYSIGDLTIYKPAADGTPVLWRTLAGVRSVTVRCADLDGDGLNDIVTTGKAGVTMQVLLQRAAGLVEQGTYPSSSVVMEAYDIGDIDGDGKADIVFFGRVAAESTNDLYAYVQSTAGQFGTPRRLQSSGTSSDSLAVASLSPGTRNVVSAANAQAIISTQGAGGQTVSSLALQSAGKASSIGVRDIDGDGRPDIALFHDGSRQLGVYYQKADGSFTAEQALSAALSDGATGAAPIAFGDFDSDGKTDIAVASQAALLLFFQD